MRKFDPHVLFTLLQRGWTIIAGAITLLLLPYNLTAVEQGYYYSFASLIAMQVFFDLGFNSVIVQLVGHEFAKIGQCGKDQLKDQESHRCRLASLIFLLRRWYRIAAVLFFLFLCPAGYVFFQSKGYLSTAAWGGPWAIQLFFTAINLYLSPFLAVSEGQGQVGQVAKLRLRQAVVGYSLFWMMLAAGAGLWATPVMPAISALMTATWLRGRHEDLVTSSGSGGGSVAISWRQEIFPFQWRIALSWISGYFIFSFFTPMIFRHQGAVEAGRIGITLTIFSSISTLGMSWVSANIPKFSMLIAQGQRRELNQLFTSVVRKSFLATAIACTMFLAAVVAMGVWDFTLAHRIASMPVLICLTVVTLANTVIFSAAAYMRAHKEEPMLWNSTTMGVAVLVAVWTFSKVSVIATMLSYSALVMLVALPWTLLLLFRHYYFRTS